MKNHLSSRLLWVRSGLIAAITAASLCSGCRASSGPAIPPPKLDEPAVSNTHTETAVFAGGCFWGTQTVFEHVRGVVSTTAGYAGGSAATATYPQVTTETTGHAESVKVVFDPARISYGRLLQVFFAVHDPTTLNRQGPDVGTSYRSAIFYTSDEQHNIAESYIAQLNAAKVFARPIVTQIVPDQGFYRAEEYHQDYALNHPDNPYIEVCDRPKLDTLKTEFPDLYTPYKGQ